MLHVRRVLMRLIPAGRRSRNTPFPRYRSPSGERMVLLSPGWVELPPGAEDRYSSEVVRRINQGRQP